MKELQQIIGAVTDAYEKVRLALVDADIDTGVGRSIELLVADLTMYEWRVTHARERK